MESPWQNEVGESEIEMRGGRPAASGYTEMRPVEPAGGGFGWGKAVVGLLVAVGLVAGGFYLGNNYKVVLNDSWPLVEVVQAGGGVLDDPLYAQVKHLMETKYLRSGELNEQEMLFGAISGMVAAAGDPYTAFYDPESNQASEEQLSGRYGGIGAELGYNEDRQVVVIAPIPDTPAEAAGLRSGDLLVSVDGESAKGMTLQDVVNRIRGEQGTEVVLVVQRGGEASTRTIEIVRQEIVIKSVTLEFRDEVAYLKLSRFGDSTEEEWNAAVGQILARGSSAMVLDMRNNPGGYLDAAIHIGSEFFRDGVIVGQEDATGQVNNFESTRAGRLADIPVVVLINEGSASASEIVAGALQARDRATVVGMTSFGKGSVQQVVDLAGGTSLHVTIARWVLPNGQNIDEQGIEPDIEVELTEEDVAAERDPQLERAMTEARQ